MLRDRTPSLALRCSQGVCKAGSGGLSFSLSVDAPASVAACAAPGGACSPATPRRRSADARNSAAQVAASRRIDPGYDGPSASQADAAALVAWLQSRFVWAYFEEVRSRERDAAFGRAFLGLEKRSSFARRRSYVLPGGALASPLFV